MIGTARNAQIPHHILDQNISDNIITVELILSLSHMILGSKKLPDIICGTSIHIASKKDMPVASNCTNE